MFNFKNPQTIHIISEVVVLIALVIWVSSYKKKINSQVDKLHLRLEEQEEKIQKLEAVNSQLQQSIQQQRNLLLQHQSFLENLTQGRQEEHSVKETVPIVKSKKSKNARMVQETPSPQPIVQKKPPPVVNIEKTPKSEEADSEAESITDLDEELADELKDLEVEELDTEDKLKKKHQK